jgi:oligopeptide/dipeptide ABC transporter ATP-binding protein
MSSSSGDFVLDVRSLTAAFEGSASTIVAVNDVSFTLSRGETLAVVGESGSGKSMLAYSITRLLPAPGRIVAGSVLLGGQDLARLDEGALRRLRGRELAIIFQEPSTSLNPLMTVGQQVLEVIATHQPEIPRASAMREVIERFRLVGIPAPEQRVHDYPHQLSGGMRQRVMIAMALACGPSLLLADEPTTALDVTVQAQVLALIDELKARLGMAVILITHDLGVVADHADRVLVMYAGRIVEELDISALDTAVHPYTRALMACRPSVDRDLDGAPLREIPGMVPALDHLPRGCAFADRCELAEARCRETTPILAEVGHRHRAACFVAYK